MPVGINKATGLAENIDDAAFSQGNHDVPMVDNQGQAVAVPYNEAASLLQQGYRQPDTDELNSVLQHAKYNSGMEQAKTFGEGAASAATFGLSTGLESAMGVDPEAIRARREANPGMHGLGQAAGLAGSMLTGVGEGAMLESMAARLVPKLGENAVGRIGTAAAKAAAENMIFQSGDEASKAFMLDPEQSASSVINDIGLAAVIGGGTGGAFKAANELWHLGPGKQINQILTSVENRSASLPEELKNSANIQIPPEVETALGPNEQFRASFQKLNEANTSSGDKARAALNDFWTNAKAGTLETLGKSANDVDNVASLSDYESGKSLKESLVKEFKQTADPIVKKYQEFETKFKAAPVTDDMSAAMQSKLVDYASDTGILKNPSSSEHKLFTNLLNEMPLQKTADDLKNYATRLTQENPYGSPNYYAAKQLRNILLETQDTALESYVGAKAPELFAEYGTLKGAYRDIKGQISDLNDRLHAGKSGGVESFLRNVQEMSPEDVLRRLSPKGDVDLQTLLNSNFPELATKVKQAEIDKLLKKSISKDEFNLPKFFKQVDGLSPEMRGFLFTGADESRINAIKELVNRVPVRLNPSGTARTLDAMWSKGPAGAIGMMAELMGKSGFMYGVAAHLGSKAVKEGADAVQLALLRFMSSGEKVSAEGFAQAAKVASSVIKAQKVFSSATQASLGLGGKLVASVTNEEREKLKKALDHVQTNPDHMLAVGGKMGDYLPDTAGQLGLQVGQAASYLSTLKPSEVPLGPMDDARVPSPTEEARYNAALDIAQSPLTIYNKINQGTLTPNDMKDLSGMYPALMSKMQKQLLHEMVGAKAAGKKIPYKVKLGAAIFTGSNLHSSIVPNNLKHNQSTFISQPANQKVPGVVKNPGKLDKLPGLEGLPGLDTSRRSGHR